MAFPAVGHHCPLFGTKLLGDRGTCVSNLPKVVVGTWIDRESKPRESNVLTITETGVRKLSVSLDDDHAVLTSPGALTSCTDWTPGWRRAVVVSGVRQ